MVGLLSGIIILVLLLTYLGTGVAAFLMQATTKATICEVISRTAFVAMILMFAFAIVPRLREMMIGFGVELPAPTLVIINLLYWTVWQAILFTFLMTSCVVTDGVVFGLFHYQQSSRRLTQWISFAITIFLTLIPLFIIVGLYMPLLKLMNDLA